MKSLVKNLTTGGADVASMPANLGLLILRAFAGLSLALAHGLGKMPPSDQFVEGVGRLGFPMPGLFAWGATVAELGGGLLLAIGLFTRPSAVLIACTMSVAAFLQHGSDPYNVKERALLFLAVALLFLFMGAGRFSIDGLIRGKKG